MFVENDLRIRLQIVSERDHYFLGKPQFFFFLSGQSTEAFSFPPPLGLAVKRTTTNFKSSFFFSGQPLTPSFFVDCPLKKNFAASLNTLNPKTYRIFD